MAVKIECRGSENITNEQIDAQIIAQLQQQFPDKEVRMVNGTIEISYPRDYTLSALAERRLAVADRDDAEQDELELEADIQTTRRAKLGFGATSLPTFGGFPDARGLLNA